VVQAGKKRIAIITGASSGIGAAFARELDRSSWDIDEAWLLARRLEPMQALAGQLRRVRGVPIAIDLTAQGALGELAGRMEEEGADVRLLINNAGFGKSGTFARLGLSEQLEMIDLNIRALTELTWRAIPRMAAGSAIIQVSSSIAYVPAPGFAVYAASKAFVLSFAQALSQELEPRHIRVLALCPGPVQTEFFSVASASEARPGEVAAQASAGSAAMAKPESVARRALADLQRGKAVSVYGALIKAFVFAAPFLPRKPTMRAIGRRRSP
jgi:short-subunit dehydrogenase